MVTWWIFGSTSSVDDAMVRRSDGAAGDLLKLELSMRRRMSRISGVRFRRELWANWLNCYCRAPRSPARIVSGVAVRAIREVAIVSLGTVAVTAASW